MRFRLELATWAVVREHDQPSHRPSASPPRDDLRLTQPIVDGATPLDVKLHDHIIVGNGGRKWVSLAQRGAL